MNNTVVVLKTSEITTLKVGMWLELRTLISPEFVFVHSRPEFVFVHSISDGHALLSNGINATLTGNIVDDSMFSSLSEVTLREISSEQYQQELNAQSDYADSMDFEDDWSPPDNFENGTDDEREIWEDFYQPKIDLTKSNK